MYNDPELESRLRRLHQDALQRVVQDDMTVPEAVEKTAEVMDGEVDSALRADAEWLTERANDDEWDFQKMLSDNRDDQEYCPECGVQMREKDGERLCTSHCPRDPYYYGEDE